MTSFGNKSLSTGGDSSISEKPVALVTGGATRLGKTISQSLGATYRVAIHYNQSRKAAELLSLELEGSIVLGSDLTSPRAPSKLVEELVGKLGRIDVLVNNAAVFYNDGSDMLQLAKMKILNLDAPKQLMRAAVPHLEKSGGSIINISDIAGIRPYTDYKAYCTSKSALIEYGSRSALGLAKQNIRVNTICPGMVLPSENQDKEELDLLKSHIPLGRFGTPQDVANLVAFLAEANFIVGQTIAVDGGRILSYFDDKSQVD